MAQVAQRKYSPRRPREQRREQLLDGALRVLDSDGFGGLTVEGVAREVDLAKTVVYDTLGSREDLLKALLAREQERALSTLADALPKPPLADDPQQVLTEALTVLLEGVGKHPETWRLILLPPEGTPPVVRKTVDRQRGLLLRQVEPIVAWGLRRIGEHAIRLALTQPDRFPPERFAGFAADLLATIAAPTRQGAG